MRQNTDGLLLSLSFSSQHTRTHGRIFVLYALVCCVGPPPSTLYSFCPPSSALTPSFLLSFLHYYSPFPNICPATLHDVPLATPDRKTHIAAMLCTTAAAAATAYAYVVHHSAIPSRKRTFSECEELAGKKLVFYTSYHQETAFSSP